MRPGQAMEPLMKSRGRTRWMGWPWSGALLTLVMGCTARESPEVRTSKDAEAEQAPAPKMRPLPGESKLYPGWPTELRPRLTPREALTVQLREESMPSAAPSARCTLPPTDAVNWTRSRVRTTGLGQLKAERFVEVSKVKRLPSNLQIKPSRFLLDEPTLLLQLEKGQTLEVWARVRGRCLTGLGGALPTLGVPCPAAGTTLDPEPEQSWWLEVACTNGEGWFEVDPEAFDIEHFPE